MKNSSLDETLAELSRAEYTWADLQQRPLPDGVDPSRMEKYLCEKDFQVFFLLFIEGSP